MSDNMPFSIRKAYEQEFAEIGQLLVRVYSSIEGFPDPLDQPNYYALLSNVAEFTLNPETELLVAVGPNHKIIGTVVYFGSMSQYGSGGIATQVKNASAFRFLAVAPEARGQGIGKLLTQECINKAKTKKHTQLILHSTKSMEIAWHMYERLGFKRSDELDFMQGALAVFGFRMILVP